MEIMIELLFMQNGKMMSDLENEERKSSKERETDEIKGQDQKERENEQVKVKRGSEQAKKSIAKQGHEKNDLQTLQKEYKSASKSNKQQIKRRSPSEEVR